MDYVKRALTHKKSKKQEENENKQNTAGRQGSNKKSQRLRKHGGTIQDKDRNGVMIQSRKGVVPSFITQVTKDGKPAQYFASEDETLEEGEEGREKVFQESDSNTSSANNNNNKILPTFLERLCSCFKFKKQILQEEKEDQSIQEESSHEQTNQREQSTQQQQQLNIQSQRQQQQQQQQQQNSNQQGQKLKGPYQTNAPKIIRPQSPKLYGKKSLVIDLDETLVHSSFTVIQNADFTLQITVQNMPFTVYVKKRPGCELFINELSKYFEIIIYTASLAEYADPVMDIIDKKNVCSLRLFRENCTLYNGVFVKDLSLMNRDLKDVIIIDNSETSFLFQPANAVHIKSFFDDMKDRELYRLIPMLIFLSNSYDVRHVGNQWQEFEMNDFVDYRDRKNRLQRLNKIKMLEELGDLRQKDIESQSQEIDNDRNRQQIYSSGESNLSPKDSAQPLQRSSLQKQKSNSITTTTTASQREPILQNTGKIGILMQQQPLKDKQESISIDVEDNLPAPRDMSSSNMNELESVRNQLLSNVSEVPSTKARLSTPNNYNSVFRFNEYEDYNSKMKSSDPYNFKTQPDAIEENSASYKEMREVFDSIRYSYNNQNINSPVSKQKFVQLLHTNSYRKKTEKGAVASADGEQHFFVSPKLRESQKNNSKQLGQNNNSNKVRNSEKSGMSKITEVHENVCGSKDDNNNNYQQVININDLDDDQGSSHEDDQESMAESQSKQILKENNQKREQQYQRNTCDVNGNSSLQTSIVNYPRKNSESAANSSNNMNQKKLGIQENNNQKNLSVHEIIQNLNKSSTNSNVNLQDNKMDSGNKNLIGNIEGKDKTLIEKSQNDNQKIISNLNNPIKKKQHSVNDDEQDEDLMELTNKDSDELAIIGKIEKGDETSSTQAAP